MARRSLIKMYNKVLDNVESVQSPSRTYALVPLQHYRTPYEDPDGVSKLEINRKYYDSDTSVREKKKTKVSKCESHPYIPPKFHVRRKEDLIPTQTPHWSNKHGLEYKQSVKSNFEDSVYVAPKKVIAIGKRRSPRIKRCTKIETGPYTTPMFFEPKKYTGTKRNEILVSVDNKVPPSLQMWASPRGKREQTLSELNKELFDEHAIQERKSFTYKVAEPAKEEKSDKKPKPYVYKPRLVTQSRTIADDLYSLSLKRYKRMLEKNRYKEPVNTSLPTYGNEKWKLSVRKSEKPDIKKPEIKSDERDVYGNESWRNHIKIEPRQNEETKIGSSLVKDVLKSRKYVALDQYANDMIKEFSTNKELKPDNWDDIEPVLPSFLSTVSRVEKAKKPEVIEKKVEPKVEIKKPKSAPVRPKTKARAPSRQKDPEISLFKHFQTRSRLLRKQHSLIEKKKGVVRKRVASKAESYYSSKQDEDPETADDERMTAYKPGTLYDIDDDGFKVVANDAVFLQNSHNGDKYNVSSMFGYPNIFIR